ncbi:MAG: hypothetical protein GTN86_09495 [Xanthomonadales bacterium]|nr:hypothetical protein [Xanthomonadales bacterium]NIO14257.1 hypothetical protein [Xanthomonadales bacterium]NIP76560.1 hypothetical protein [Xanthomonadales bacterium]NIQ36137.1 hypothetical protein [Xanthomonadales bacterium]NIT08822.1 hypothetical protein [Xanthomonadales bacterium]
MNLLNLFILQHVQLSVLHAELSRSKGVPETRDAKVELNLAPAALGAASDAQLPAYQVSARLNCEAEAEAGETPVFRATVGLEAVYQQQRGEPVDLMTFAGDNASLARQLYPMLQQEMRALLHRMGVTGTQLPFDLESPGERSESSGVAIIGSVH